MEKNISFDINEIFEEIVERGREDGITEAEVYADLCEEVLYEHEEDGQLSVNSNVENKLAALRARFNEYVERLK